MGFRCDTSLKPGPGPDKFNKLFGYYLVDGLVTAGEPLYCRFPANSAPPCTSFVPWTGTFKLGDLGYMKGESRMDTMHCFLVWCWLKKIDLSKAHPVLCNSIRAIYFHMFQPV